MDTNVSLCCTFLARGKEQGQAVIRGKGICRSVVAVTLPLPPSHTAIYCPRRTEPGQSKHPPPKLCNDTHTKTPLDHYMSLCFYIIQRKDVLQHTAVLYLWMMRLVNLIFNACRTRSELVDVTWLFMAWLYGQNGRSFFFFMIMPGSRSTEFYFKRQTSLIKLLMLKLYRSFLSFQSHSN